MFNFFFFINGLFLRVILVPICPLDGDFDFFFSIIGKKVRLNTGEEWRGILVNHPV